MKSRDKKFPASDRVMLSIMAGLFLLSVAYGLQWIIGSTLIYLVYKLGQGDSVQ